MKTLFEKIIDREIPADVVYEDDLCIAIRDIHPQAPIHILIIPKKPVETLQDLTDSELAGHLLTRVPTLAEQLGVSDSGYRLVINCKEDGGQEVNHLHLHLLGGRSMHWPPG